MLSVPIELSFIILLLRRCGIWRDIVMMIVRCSEYE